jgi:hypothetical protein
MPSPQPREVAAVRLASSSTPILSEEPAAMRRPLFTVLTACLLLGALPAAHAAEDDGWHGRLELPLWLYVSQGNVAVGGQEVDVDTSMADTLDSFSSITGAFSGVAEVGRGRWRAFVGGSHIQLEDPVVVGPLHLTSITEIEMWDLGIGWRLRGDARGDTGYVDLIGGMRSFDTDVTLRNDDTGGEVRQSKERSVGFVGVKGGQPLSERWMLEYRADAGGFSNNNMNWQAYLGARRVWDNGAYLSLGYRFLDVDYTASSGSGYTVDLLQHGPSFALGWRF